MPKKKALALVPAAARMPAVSQANRVADVPKSIRDAIQEFETKIGGRQALLEALSTADSSEDVKAVLDVIADPKFDETPLALLCAKSGIAPGQLFGAFKTAAIVRGQILGSLSAAKAVPVVVEEIARASVPHDAICTACNAVGIVRDPKGKESPCGECNGVGRIRKDPNPDQQRTILELTGLVKTGGGIGVNVQTNVLAASPSQGGSLEQLQQAVSELIYSRPADPVKDAELVKP